MQRKFLSNLFITLSANLLIKPIWILGVDRTFQNRLGLDSYGLYTNLFTFSVVLGLLLDFGINNYNTSSLARSPQLLQKQFYPLAILKLTLSLCYMVLTLLLGWGYGYASAELYLLAILAFNQCLAYGSTYLRSTLTGLQLYKTDALISATDRLTMVVGGSAVLLMNTVPITIQTFVYVQTLGYAVAFAISAWTIQPHIKQFQIRVDWQQITTVFRKSAPYALLALLMMLYTRSDVLLIRKLLPYGDTENGIYAQSTRLLEAVNMLAVLVSGLLLPMFSRLLNTQESITPLVRLAMLLLLVPAIAGVVWCWFNAHYVMLLLYHTMQTYHAEVFVWCITSIIPLCVMYVFGTLLTAAGKLRLLISVAAVALVVNLILNSLLIPMYGAKGSAIAVLLTHSLVAVSNAWFALKQLPAKVSIGIWLRFLLLAVLSSMCLWVLAFLDGSVYLSSFIYLLMVVGIVWMLRLVDPQQVTKFFNRLRNQ